MAIIENLKLLVECESPTEDLAACVAFGLDGHQVIECRLHLGGLQSGCLEIRFESSDARFRVGVVLDIVGLHVLLGVFQMSGAKHDAEEVISDLLVGCELLIRRLQKHRLILGRDHRQGPKNRRAKRN